MTLILTVDVEDWAQSTIDTNLPIADRAQRNMEYLLDLLEEEQRTVTCFVLGKFAERFPQTVKRIATNGHEIASHGYGHVDVFRQKQDAFRDDVRRSKAQLEDMTGQKVLGYRAPDFSVVKNALWALSILAEEGFLYDASINPAIAARFGIPGWPKEPVLVQTAGNPILEIPVATRKMWGRDWPVAGGGYHRLLPWPLIRYFVDAAEKRSEVFTAYCHPYEFDPEEFSYLDIELPLKTRLHQGLGRRSFERKFRKLINSYSSIHASALLGGKWKEYDPEITMNAGGQ